MFFFKSYPNLTVLISCFFWGTYWIPLRYLNNDNNASVWPIFISFLILSAALLTTEIIGFKELLGAFLVIAACSIDVLNLKKFSEYFSK